MGDTGAGAALDDGALIATPVHAEVPDRQRVQWKVYNGKKRGSRLIRLAPWFDDGSLTVTLQDRYFWHNAAEAHREVEKGHTEGKIALIVDVDLSASLEV